MGLQAALDFWQLFFHTSRSPRPLTTNTGCTGTKLVPIRPCIPNLCFAHKWLVSSLSYLTWLTTPAMSTTFYIHFTTLTTSLDDSDTLTTPWVLGFWILVFGNKLMFRIEQGLLRLLRTKPHRKYQSVVRNLWYCTHLFNSVLSITFLANFVKISWLKK